MAIVLCGFVDGPAGTGQGMLVQFGPTLLVDIGFDVNHVPNSPVLPDLAVKGRACVGRYGGDHKLHRQWLGNAAKPSNY